MASYCIFQVKIKSEPLTDELYDDGVVIDASYPDPEQVCFIHLNHHRNLDVSLFCYRKMLVVSFVSFGKIEPNMLFQDNTTINLK